MPQTLNINVDYQKLQVFTEKNANELYFPLIITIPHAGTLLPESFKAQSGLTEQELRANEDLFVDELLSPLAAQNLTLISLNISRAFIDVNRDKTELDPQMFADYPDNQLQKDNSRCRFGLGLIHRISAQNKPLYQGLLSFAEVQSRIQNIYDVYHQQIERLIEKSLQKFGYCFILDCHSMPSKICGIIPDSPQIDFCLGNLFNKSCPSYLTDFLARRLARNNRHVALNLPYSGAYTTFNYARPRRKIYTLQLEINRNLYADEKNLQKKACFQCVSSEICAALVDFSKKVLDF